MPINNNNCTNNGNHDSSSKVYRDELVSLCNKNSMDSLNLGNPFFGHKYTSLQRVLADANKTIEKSTKFLNKIKSKQVACNNRIKSIPENATIRKEYTECGKEMCELRHGPYYYAYWKDPESKKLKKMH